jgi:MFS family permease
VNTRWTLVFALGLSLFMVTLDSTIVNVALPAIAEGFTATPLDTQWVVLGYLLPTLTLLLPVGRWLDTVGRRPSFILGLSGFAAASVLAALAPSLAMLVAMRVLQGIFGTLLVALTFPMIAEAVRPEKRGRAMGVVFALASLGAASGPAVGGLLLEAAGWPLIFLINLAVSLAAVGLALRTMRGGGGLHAPDKSWLLETSLLAGASLSFFGGLAMSESWGITGFGLWVATGILLVAWSRLRAAAPVKRLVTTRSFALPLGAFVLVNTTGMLIAYLAPFFLTRTVHASPATVGFTILMIPLAMGIIGPAAGYLSGRPPGLQPNGATGWRLDTGRSHPHRAV